MSTRKVMVGQVPIGGGAPVTIQSMTNTDTRDVEATLAQIRALRIAGCEIVRCSVYDMACAQAMRPISEQAGIPVVADVHFDYRLGIAAVENGAQKLRINPGNIGGADRVRMVADCCRAHRVPIRIGVNGGSLEKALLHQYGGPTAEAMVESALSHIALLENCGFTDILVSLKASDVPMTVQACRLFAQRSQYPQHIGVTEAGTPETGRLYSAIGIGALLLDGIGDTVRVSLSGDPLPEPGAALDILRACGLRSGARVIACPTCGRAGYDVAAAARRVEERLKGVVAPLRVAVMGCVVNGPGEAREADMGIAGGASGGVMFVKGKPARRVPLEQLVDILLEEVDAWLANYRLLTEPSRQPAVKIS